LFCRNQQQYGPPREVDNSEDLGKIGLLKLPNSRRFKKVKEQKYVAGSKTSTPKLQMREMSAMLPGQQGVRL
jgi:hypothetical protein